MIAIFWVVFSGSFYLYIYQKKQTKQYLGCLEQPYEATKKSSKTYLTTPAPGKFKAGGVWMAPRNWC